MKKKECGNQEIRKNTRIVKNTRPDGVVYYTIEKRHFIFRWKWERCRLGSGLFSIGTWDSLESAKRDLCWFDGTPEKREVLK